jgi:hypothetical protein
MKYILLRMKHALMYWSRERKYNEIIKYIQPNSTTRILDVGCADKEYSPYDNYFEKKFPFRSNITALSIYTMKEFTMRYPDINVCIYEGGVFPFEDNEYDVAISNAVIEHVGDYYKQLLFLGEMLRVAKQIYIVTPAKEFPVEMHTNFPFIHWLPKQYFNLIVRRLGKGWAVGKYVNLLYKAEIIRLLGDCGIKQYQLITHKLGPFPMHHAILVRKQ